MTTKKRKEDYSRTPITLRNLEEWCRELREKGNDTEDIVGNLVFDTREKIRLHLVLALDLLYEQTETMVDTLRRSGIIRYERPKDHGRDFREELCLIVYGLTKMTNVHRTIEFCKDFAVKTCGFEERKFESTLKGAKGTDCHYLEIVEGEITLTEYGLGVILRKEALRKEAERTKRAIKIA